MLPQRIARPLLLTGERLGASMQRLEGTGRIGDRAAFLEALHLETPEVLADLAGHLGSGPQAQSDGIARWGRRWNLLGGEGTQAQPSWVIEAAAETLSFWAIRLKHAPPSEIADYGWSFTTGGWGGEKIPVSTRLHPDGGHARAWRSRDKHLMGDAVAELRTADQVELLAFARWQALGEGVVLVRRRWEELAPRSASRTDRRVIDAMRAWARKLELPDRPPAKPGRPALPG